MAKSAIGQAAAAAVAERKGTPLPTPSKNTGSGGSSSGSGSSIAQAAANAVAERKQTSTTPTPLPSASTPRNDYAEQQAKLAEATRKAQQAYDDYAAEARIYQKNYGKESEKAKELKAQLNDARIAERDAKNENAINSFAAMASQYKDDKAKKSDIDTFRSTEISDGVRAKEGNYAWKMDTYKAMSDQEVEVYNRLAKNGKEKEAKEFLEALTPYLNARVTKSRTEASVDQSKGFLGGVGASLASSLLKPIAAIEGGIKAGLDFKQGKAIDTAAPEYFASNLSNSLRTSVAQRIEQGVYESTVGDYSYDKQGNRQLTSEGEARNNGKIAAFLYTSGMSMADMMVMMPFGATGMKLMMSSNAGVDTMLSAKNVGATDEQALSLGLIAAGAEWIFEKYSIENLFHGNVSASTGAAMLKQGGIEGSEELFTEITNIIANESIMGSLSDYNLAVAEYVKMGLAPQDARNEALKEILLRLPQAFAGGLISGGIMGGVADISRTNAAGVNAIDTYLGNEFDDHLTDYTKKAREEAMAAYLETGMTQAEAERAVAEDREDISKRASEMREEERKAYVSDKARRAEAETMLTEAYREDASDREGIAGKVAKNKGSLGRQVMANTDADIADAVEAAKAKYEAEGKTPDQVKSLTKRFEKDLRYLTAKVQNATSPGGRLFWSDKYNDLLNSIDESENTETAEVVTKETKDPTKAEKKVRLFESRIAKETARLNSLENKNSYEAMQIKENIRKLRSELRSWERAVEAREDLDRMTGKAKAPKVLPKTFAEGLPTRPQATATEQYDRASEQIRRVSDDIYELRKQIKKAKNPKVKASLQKSLDALLEQRNSMTIKTGITAPVRAMPGVTVAGEHKAGDFGSARGNNRPDTNGVIRDFSRDLNDNQRDTIEVLDRFAKGLGRSIRLVENLHTDGSYNVKDENGNYVEGDANGLFNRATGEYFISLNSMGEGYTYIAMHESVHDIAKNATEEYAKLHQIVFEALDRHGYDTAQMVADRMKQHGETEAVAIEEVLANTVPSILRDAETANQLVDRILEADEQTKSAFLRFIDTLKEYFERAYNVLKGSKDWKQMDAISKDLEAVDRIREQYLKGLETIKMKSQLDVDAIQDAIGSNSEQVVDDNGNPVAVADGANLVFSVATYENRGRDLLEKTLKTNGHTETEISDTIKKMDEMSKFLKDIEKDTRYGRLRDSLYAEPSVGILKDKAGKQHVLIHTLVKNGDYPINLEMSTDCKKRQAYQRVINQLIADGVFNQVAYNDEAIARVRQILQDKGFETACAVCFVESKRTQIQKFAETIVNEWNEAVDARVEDAESFDFYKGTSKMTEAELIEYENMFRMEKKNSVGNTNLGTGSPATKMGRLMDKYPQLRKHLSVGDIATPQGMRELRKLMPDMFSIIRSRFGAGTMKFIQGNEAYNSDVALLTYKYLKDELGVILPNRKGYMARANNNENEALRLYLLDIGGARSQSFSDALIENVFDKLQMYTDVAARNFSLQEYTKEISTARIFGMTGVKQNLSVIHIIDPKLGTENAGLMMVDGKLTYVAGDYEASKKLGTHIQSIGWKDSVALQNDPRYSSNVGTIAIGFSDKHIGMMLDDPNIRMIIPYHASGLPHGFAEITGVYVAKDYTNTQETGIKTLYDLDGNEIPMPEDFKKSYKVDTSFLFNKAFQETGDARAAAQRYLDWCAERHEVRSKNGKSIVGYATFTPKFEDFSGHENYYKMLEDFNSYDAITEAPAVQHGLTMTYPSAENALTAEQLDKYRQRLRDTGIFSENEIEHYVEVAQRDMQTLIQKELSFRQQYNEKQDAVFDSTMEEITKMLKEEFPRQTTAEDNDLRASLMQLEDGTKFVQIDQNQDRFEGKDESEYPRIAKEIIKEKFRNRVVGITNRAYVNVESEREFAYPAKKGLDQEIYNDKMLSAPELDNLIEAGRNYRNAPDGADGHVHKNATGGFDYYDTLFKVGNRWYQGVVNIEVTDRGKRLKDITKIEDVTSAIQAQYGKDPQVLMLSTSSINSISSQGEKVNEDLRSSPIDLGEQANVRDLGKINVPDPDIGSIRIEAEGRNEYQKAFVDDFNRRHVTPAEPANTTSYTTNKLPPHIIAALRDKKRIEREYNALKESTHLSSEEMDALDALYKGGYSLDEAIQAVRSKYSGINVSEAADYYNMYERYMDNQRAVSNFNRQRKAELFEAAQTFTADAINWQDKKTGLQYARETMERNNFDIMSHDEAEAINSQYFAPVHENEANNTRWKKDLIKRMNDLKLNKWESKYVHALINEQDLTQNRMGKAGVQEALDYTHDAMNKLLKSHGQLIDVKKCRNAVPKVLEIFRDIYTDLTDAEIRNGYAATEFYNTYAPNISDDSNLGFFERIAQSLGFEQGDMRLPTDLAGLTAGFKPGKPWFQYSLSRHSHMTAFDIHKAFDQYIRGAGNVVWHTDDIQRLRSLETAIRYQFSEEGIRKQIMQVLQDGTLDPDEQFEKIQQLSRSNKNLGNYVTNLTEYTNLLAGKKSIHDRGAESDFGRAIYRIMNNVQGRVAGNVIGGNISVALSNFIPLTQALSGVRADSLAKAMLEAGGSFAKDDGFDNQSNFLTNRQNVKGTYRTAMTYVDDALSAPFNAIDRFVSSSMVRARYAENIERGMSHEEAMLNADTWAASVIADRSKGALPTIFGRTNPIAKLFNMFQVEANNQLSYMAKDVVRDTKELNPTASTGQIATFVAGRLFAMWLAAFGYNKLREYVGLTENAFDPISWVEDVYGEVEKYKEGDQTRYDTVKNITKETADQIPFVGGFLGGEGRYSVVQSALPKVGDIIQAYETDQQNEAGGKYFKSVLSKELQKPLFYYLLPTAGGQIKKTKDGLVTVIKGGSETVNKQGETILQYPVEKSAGNLVKAAVFGKSTLPEAKAWVESGFDSLSPKQTEMYREFEGAGGETMDFITYQKRYDELTKEIGKSNKQISEKTQEIAAANPMLTDAEAKERAQKMLGLTERNADNEFMLEIQNSSMSDLQKLAAISAIGYSDEQIDTIRGLMDNGISVSDYLKYDRFYRDRGDTDTEDKNALVSALMADKSLSESQKTMLANKLIDGDWIVDFSSQAANDILTKHGKNAYANYKEAKAEGGLTAETYLQYENTADRLISDYDAYGTSISYSKKAKIVNYLDSLNIPETQKEWIFYNLFGYTSKYEARHKSLKQIDGVWCYNHDGKWIKPSY